MLKPMQLPKQAIMKPSFQGSVARKPTEYVRVGQWSAPQDKYAQRSLGGILFSLQEVIATYIFTVL